MESKGPDWQICHKSDLYASALANKIEICFGERRRIPESSPDPRSTALIFNIKMPRPGWQVGCAARRWMRRRRRRVYRKARWLLKCRVESFRPSSTNGSCCQRRCQDDAMGMMVGGFFAAAAAASSLSQIDVKPRTQHVKYFISTLIRIYIYMYISSLLCVGSSYVHGSLFLSWKISSPAARSLARSTLWHLMKKHFYADI